MSQATISNNQLNALVSYAAIKESLNFVRACLRDLDKNPDVVKAVLNSYDLNSFIGTWAGNRVELASHFIQHVTAVEKALSNF